MPPFEIDSSWPFAEQLLLLKPLPCGLNEVSSPKSQTPAAPQSDAAPVATTVIVWRSLMLMQ
ncbi:hypothetical protein FGA82_25525 [Pseudomonas fluorescens]|nr:hypothetical protein FGA82_25525 [Pseudomonas fluorescens]